MMLAMSQDSELSPLLPSEQPQLLDQSNGEGISANQEPTN